MKGYRAFKVRQSFASLLDQARREGHVGIRRKDGSLFILQPQEAAEQRSPLDVAGVDLGLSKEEIVDFVREGRRS